MNNTNREHATVMVCDDDITIRLLMSETLRNIGLTVVEAQDGQEAIDKFEQYQPDMILLDVEMPYKNGFEVCRYVRQHPRGKSLPIIMITGSDDMHSIQHAYNTGATDFQSKPLKWSILAQRVRYMLRASQAFKDLSGKEKELRQLAYFDTLTGLPNRQNFHEKLDKFLHLADRKDYKAAILYLDLDRFKRINDTLGHSYGDELLIKVAQRLNQNLRVSDVLGVNNDDNVGRIARLGGDEFIIFLSEIDNRQDIAAVAERVINTLSQPTQLKQHEVVVTPSIGIAIYPDDGRTTEELLKNADTAMYHAKEKGRSCYKFYDDTMNSSALRRLTMEQQLRNAIIHNQLSLDYQPQICLHSRSVVSIEALIRWHHPVQGVISPADFIPLAEETGQIIEIGDWVIRTACRQAKEWSKQGLPPLKIAVNLSSLQFKQPQLADKVAAILEEVQLPASQLELEVTESMIMSDAKDNIARLEQLKELGVALAVDDFGTGYSSLNYLKKFPIDTLKIDRSFITDIATDNGDFGIVKAVTAMALHLRMNVVAEGIEDHQQLRLLQETDCDLVQGFLFSRPVPAEQLPEVLRRDFAAIIAEAGQTADTPEERDDRQQVEAQLVS